MTNERGRPTRPAERGGNLEDLFREKTDHQDEPESVPRQKPGSVSLGDAVDKIMQGSPQN